MTSPNNTQKVIVLVPVVTVSLVEVEREIVLRPWKEHEVPIGAFFQGYSKTVQRITGYDPRYSCIHSPAILLSKGRYSFDDHYFINDLVTSVLEPKYSWDGVTWFRCGTWVPAE